MSDPFVISRVMSLVTGGAGFIGSAFVRALVAQGARVRSLDNHTRGSAARLGDAVDKVDMVVGDIRDPDAVRSAVKGMDTVCHLAYINGTEYFYQIPETILEVAVKGMMNVLDACLAEGVRQLMLASSSEVYQDASVIPTPEAVPLVVPDVHNPRYSYGGGKIISELLLLNYGRKYFDRAMIFRPHNVYGPDMGREHVIPQFAIRMKEAFAGRSGIVDFPIQGTGQETRAFIYIDDLTEALLLLLRRGEHLGVYHLGTDQEVPVSEVAGLVASCLGRSIRIVPGALQPGSASRRCPDIHRLRALGFEPRTTLDVGVAKTVAWYNDRS